MVSLNVSLIPVRSRPLFSLLRLFLSLGTEGCSENKKNKEEGKRERGRGDMREFKEQKIGVIGMSEG